MDNPLQVWTFDEFVGVASVISEKVALSAAHCFNETDPSKYHLLGGTAMLNGTDGVQFNIDKLIKHPGFDAATKNYDIAVIRIVESFLELPNVAFIPLQNTFISSTSTRDCSVLGWGSTVNGTVSDTLQSTAMQIRPQLNCVNTWDFLTAVGTNGSITPQMFCAESEASDVCRGDSGGGLICNGRLAGLLAWDEDECNGRGPTFFTRVSNYEIRKFIRDHAGV
uniref:Peptidase S1 domain-containing protein n=1 Tax=Anopheles atroparvus TaxID=41427 RepID=A0AAG5DRV4_ANOAO